jgi:prophage tail gpP-like protein
LLGKWQLQNFAYTITKQNGTTVVDRVDAKARNIVIFYEFFSDGKLVLTQDGQTLQGRWTLKVKALDGKDIQEGSTLTISGPSEWRELAQSLGQSGDLTYEIGTSSSAGSAALMSLSIDVTSQGPYKKNILIYTLSKL